MDFKTYESYKDSGIGWIGEIPQNWNISRVKNYFAIRSGDSPVKKESGKYEIIGANGCIGVTDDFNITEKHITIGRVGAAGAINITPQKAFVSDNALILEFNRDFIFNYAFYLFKSLNWDSLINKNAQPLITSSQVKNLFIPEIRIDEQLEISKFLDKKTSEIDKNIAKNKELISLLEEKKIALINQAVTKGLDHDVPMKDSGIEWIGEIPEHWDVAFLKRFIHSISSGKTKNLEENGLYPLYGSTGIIGTTNSLDYEGLYILIARVGANAGRTHIAKGKMGITDNTLIIDYTSKINYKFLYYILSTTDFKRFTIGSGQPLITGNAVKNIKIGVPDLVEQEQIVNYLDNEIPKIDETISKIWENIDLLEEYKASLIYHVVTGKIDVRDEV